MNPRDGYLFVIVVALSFLVLIFSTKIEIQKPMEKIVVSLPIEYEKVLPPKQPIAHIFVIKSTLKDRILESASLFANKHNFILNEYDCTEFSRDLKRLLMKEYHEEGIKVEIVKQQVNCSFVEYWDKKICEQYRGWHAFVRVKIPGQDWFYIESTKGWEIKELHYPIYNLEI